MTNDALNGEIIAPARKPRKSRAKPKFKEPKRFSQLRAALLGTTSMPLPPVLGETTFYESLGEPVDVMAAMKREIDRTIRSAAESMAPQDFARMMQTARESGVAR